MPVDRGLVDPLVNEGESAIPNAPDIAAPVAPIPSSLPPGLIRIEDRGPIVGRHASGPPEPNPFAQGPSSQETIGAAWRLSDNPVAALIDSLHSTPASKFDPNHNPRDTLLGTSQEFADFAPYANSPNEATTRALIAKADQRDADLRTMAQSGWAGTAASIAADFANPIYYLPVFGELRGPLQFAAAGFGVGTLADIAQPAHPWQESALNIASTTILMGGLGGAHAHFFPGEAKKAAATLDAERPRVDVKTGNIVEPPAPEASHPAVVAAVEKVERAEGAGGYNLSAAEQAHFDRYATSSTTRTRNAFARMAANESENVVREVVGPEADSLYVDGAARIMREGKETDPWSAYERAVMEKGGEQEHLESIGAYAEGALGAQKTDARKMVPIDAAGLEHVPGIGNMSPDTRVMFHGSEPARRHLRDLAETAIRFVLGDQVAPHGPPIQSIFRVFNRQLLDEYQTSLEQSWFKHYHPDKPPGIIKGALGKAGIGAPTVGDRLSFKDFKHESYIAGISGDKHAIPEVQAHAQVQRKVLDFIKEWGQRVKGPDGKPMLSEEMGPPKGAESYMPLMPKRDAILAKYDEARKMRADWLESEQPIKEAAQGRIRQLVEEGETLAGKIKKARPEDVSPEAIAKLARLNDRQRVLRDSLKSEAEAWRGDSATLPGASDQEIDDAVKTILKNDYSPRTRQEYESRANEILDRNTGTPDGRLPYDEAGGGPQVGYTGKPGQEQDLRGSLRARKDAFPVIQLAQAGLIHTDVEHVISSTLRTLLPDILLTERFGDVNMTNALREIREFYEAKIKPGVDSKKITDARDADLRDLAGVRDIFRNVYGWDPSPSSRMLGNAVRDLQSFAVFTSLGGATLSSLNDVAGAVFRYGFANAFHGMWEPLFKGMVDPSILKIIKEQARDGAVGIEGMLGLMRHNIGDIVDNHLPGNKFSRGLSVGADTTMFANFLNFWTDWAKTGHWNVAQGEMGRAAKRITEGVGTDRDLALMADANISHEMVGRISKQYEEHHIEVKGMKLANTHAWKDKSARLSFEAAMSRETEIGIVTPGIADRPLWMSAPVYRIFGTFRSYIAAANTKILISNVQQRDARTLQGLLATLGLGAISTTLYSVTSGHPLPSNPSDFLKEAIDRSTILAWAGEYNKIASKATSGTLDLNRLYGASGPVQRRSQSSAISDFAGVGITKPFEATVAGLHALTGQANRSDLHKLRVATPWNNMFYWRRLFDEAEEGIGNSLGMKPKPGQKQGPQSVQ